MKAKLKNGLVVDVRVYMLNSGLGDSRTLYMDNYRGITYYEDELEFLPDTSEEVTIEGWVLRDDNNKIGIYREKPTCDEDGWDLTGEKYDLFPDITPDMLPKKYRITIEPME